MERRWRTKFTQYDNCGNLLCYKCNKYKSEECFDSNPKNWFRNGKDRQCKECKKQQYIKRRLANRGKKDLNRLLLERYHGILERAAKKNLECSITLDYLRELWCKQNGLCAISNIPMTYIFNNGRIPTNISVDRIDSSRGYTRDNIQLVCMAVNQMKSDLDDNTFYDICAAIVRNAAKWKH